MLRQNLSVTVVTCVMAALVCLSSSLLTQAYAAGPEDQLAGSVKIALGKSFNTDWSGLEKLPGIKWAPLPPTSLQNCLPDGGCFTRQGTATFGDRNLMVIASGARSFVTNLYFRGKDAPMGEEVVLGALKRAGLMAELARCPVKGSAGGTNWYRLKSASTNPGRVLGAVIVQRQAVRGFSIDAGRRLAAIAAQATGDVFGTMFGRSGSAQAGVDVESAGNGGAIGDRVFSIGDERCRGLGSDLEDAAQFEMVFDCSAKEPGDVQVRSEPVQHERQHGAGAAPVQPDCKRHAGAAADGVPG